MRYRFFLILCFFLSNWAHAFPFQQKWGDIDWLNDHKAVAAVDIKLEDKWHVFWQHPGSVGVPIKVTVSQNGQSEELTNFWPVPISFHVGDLEAWGYEGDVTIPIAFPSWVNLQNDYTVKIRGQVCKEVCIPFDYEAQISPELKAKEIKATQNLPLFYNDDAKVSVFFEKNKDNADQALMEVIVEQTEDFISPSLFEANKINLSYNLKERQLLSPQKVRFLMEVEGLEFLPDELIKGELRFLVADKKKSFYINGQAKEAVITKAKKTTFSKWIILQALWVGLIFNVMPCVLPVLGIKLGTVIGLSGKEKTEVRLRFSLTALGILIAFALLALLLSLAKSLGAYIGWGVHFQQPLFIAFMMLIISIFAASIFGFWHLRSPSFTTKTAQTSIVGEIGSGILATILATPCTVPFMAPVAAFAFAGSSAQLFIIFILIGIGMALPWLCIAAFPRLIGFLPKPGRWMAYVKIVLGSLLLLTLLWLFWVLLGQVHFYGAISIGLASLFIFIILGIGRKATGALASVKWIFVLGLALMTINMAIVVETYERSKNDEIHLEGIKSVEKGALQGEAYSKVKLESLLAEGKDVLVIGTAEWCITCKVNERGTFTRRDVVDALKENNIAVLIADMTVENKEGQDWLQSLDRYGLPLTVFYKQDGQVVILPTFVRKEDIFNQLQ